MKLSPKSPPPPINYIEWDGLLRVCFMRKNKSLGAIFKVKSIVKLLEKNFETFQEMKKIQANPEDNKE